MTRASGAVHAWARARLSLLTCATRQRRPRRCPTLATALTVALMSGGGCALSPSAPLTRQYGELTLTGRWSDADAAALAATVAAGLAAHADLLGPLAQPVSLRVLEVADPAALRARLAQQGQPSAPDWVSAEYPVAGGWEIALCRQWSRAAAAARLRHEVAHVAIACRFPAAPLWVHEGLALMAEAAPTAGVHAGARRQAAKQPAAGLRGLLEKHDPRTFDRADYARAWALAYRLLHDLPDGPERLRRYLASYDPAADVVAQFVAAFGPEAAGR